jgi:UDP-glucuronate decarboxylase
MNCDAKFGPWNLGNPNEMTILDAAQRIISLTGSRSKLVFRPLPKDDPMRRQPDISKAKSELSWTPTIDFDSGLKRTIEDFDKRLRAA